jgi:hypothetical protein
MRQILPKMVAFKTQQEFGIDDTLEMSYSLKYQFLLTK